MKHTTQDSGFILVTILVALTILAGLATTLLLNARQTSTKSAIIEQSLRGRIIAQSGLRYVIAAIEDPAVNPESDILYRETGYDWQLGDYPLRLWLQGEGGKINPATTDLAIISGYLDALPLDPADRAALDQLVRDGRSSGKMVTPDDLNYYLLTALSLDEVRRDFTSLHTNAGIDPRYASRAVLSAIPDVGPAKAEHIISIRRSNPLALAGLSTYFSASPPVFTVVAEALFGSERRHVERVFIEITTSGRVRTLNGFR